MRAVWRDGRARIGLVLLAGFVLTALFGPLFISDPSALVDTPMAPPSADHWLGTTGQGQDVLAQTVAGTRTSLLLGIAVGVLVVAIGTLIGIAAAYYGGWVDEVLSLLINVFLVIPGLPLIVVVAAYLPPGTVTIAAVLVITGWAWTARIMRAQALSLRQRDFVTAAELAGEPAWRVITGEILPNMTSLCASAVIGAVVYAIGAQVGLEFLGLGDPGQVTWGTNLYWASNDSALLTGSWWTFVPTGACVALVGFGLAMINTAIDAVGDPRLRRHRRFTRLAGPHRAGAPTPVVRRPS